MESEDGKNLEIASSIANLCTLIALHHVTMAISAVYLIATVIERPASINANKDDQP